MSEMTISEAMGLALEEARKAPVVRRVDGAWELDIGDGRWDYDITDAACRDAGSALRWIEHLAPKSWVTVEHLAQFAQRTAEHFGAPY